MICSFVFSLHFRLVIIEGTWFPWHFRKKNGCLVFITQLERMGCGSKAGGGGTDGRQGGSLGGGRGKDGSADVQVAASKLQPRQCWRLFFRRPGVQVMHAKRRREFSTIAMRN